MQNTPDNIFNRYIELRINRDFGAILSTYFDFLRQNFKRFANIFISYNGLFLIGLLIASYFMVTGYIGIFSYELDPYADGPTTESHLIDVFIGAGLFFMILIVVGVLNYGLSASYIVLYQEKGKLTPIDRKEVWAFTKARLGKSILFLLLVIAIAIGVFLAAVIVMIIPIIGMFAQLAVQYGLMAWIGVSYLVMMKENKGITEAFSEGWKLVFKNFWTSLGVNFILGFLNQIFLLVVMIAPTILVGLYTYHIVSNDVDFTQITPKIIYTLALCLFLLTAVFGQCLTQFVNGILYFSLHEKTYNTHLQEKIDQIGQLDAE